MATVADLEVRIGADTRDLERGLNNANRGVQGFARTAGSRMAGFARNVSVVAGGAVLGLGTAAATMAIQWEDAFADVRKTIDETDTTSFEDIEDSLRSLATSEVLGGLSNAHQQLAEIAALGGQLGVGADDIDEFAETIGALTVATNLSAEGAATFAARFANITGLDLSTDLDNLGDVIVTLGNNMATTETDIAAFGNRLANLSTFGFQPDEILAYGAAMSSLGLTAELGGTNFVKTVDQMTQAANNGGPMLQNYADVAGMTAEEFQTLAQENPAAAFDAFNEGLSQLDPSELQTALNDLNITGSEQRRVMMTLAGGYDTVTQALDLSSEAFEGNGALMEEAGAKADTTQGKINRFKNAVTDLGIEIGDRLLPGIADMAVGLTEIVQGDTATGLETLAMGFADIIEQVGSMAGIDFDVTGGLGAFIGAMEMAPQAISILFDNVKRSFQRFALEIQIAFMDFAMGFRQMVLDATGQRVDIAPDINVNTAALQEQLVNMNVADQIVQALNQQVATGQLDLGAGIDTLGLGINDSTIAESIQFDPAALAETVGVQGRQAIENALQMAMESGDEAAIQVLTPIANELELDVEQIRADMADQISTEQYEATATVDVVVAPGFIQVGQLSAAVAAQASAAVNGVTVSAGGASTGTESGNSSGGPAVFHDGGIFNAGAGRNEGFALLEDGEMILTRSQQKAVFGGGQQSSGSPIVQNIYGQSPNEVARMVERAQRDRGITG